MSASDRYGTTPPPVTEPDGGAAPAGPPAEPERDAPQAPRGFRAWRRSRPFWGGLFAVIGGVELILIPLAPLPVVIHQGIAGISSYLIGALLAVIGVLLWCQPAQRTFYGVVAVLLSLASFVTSNFGGFVIGMLFGLIGGSLGFAWTPGATRRRLRARRPGRGGTGVLGIALLPALAVLGGFPGSVPAHPAADRACLIPVFCPDDPSPSPTPARTSTAPSTVPSTAPSPAPSGRGGGRPGGGLNGADDGTGKTGDKKDGGRHGTATGKAARFVPERRHLTAHRAALGQADVAIETNTLTADKMVQYGLSFDGVVAMPTAHGKVRMLKFSADRVVMTGATLTAGHAGRRTATRQGKLALNGGVRLYTTRLHAKIFGLPLTFTPNFPPPLVLPKMTMTDVTSDQNVTMAGSAHITGLDLRTS